jgi:peroxiredoxin
MRWRDLRVAAAAARREFQISTRGAAFWALAAGGVLYALWRGSTPQATAALACYQVVQLATMGLGVVAVLFGGMAAGRDARERSTELVLSKPMGTSAGLLLARFAGTWCSLLAMVGLMLIGVFVGQLIVRGTPWNVAAYGNALARAMAPLGLAVALGYALATLFTPLASAIAALYWIAVPLARMNVPALLDFTPAQRWPISLLLAAALLAVSVARQGIAIAGSTPSRRTARWAAAGFVAATGVAVLLTIKQGDDALLRPSRVLSAISGQTATTGSRAPGFWLPNASKRIVGMSDFDGQSVVLAFWAPAVPASAHLLPVLDAVARQYRAQGVRCVAVCVDKDSATVAPFAREVSPEVTMLWDRGRHFNAAQVLLDSALANAYGVEQADVVFLVDGDRVLRSPPITEIDTVELAVRRYLREQGDSLHVIH